MIKPLAAAIARAAHSRSTHRGPDGAVRTDRMFNEGAANLKRWRAKHGLTQAETAALLGMKTRAIEHIERRGHRHPRLLSLALNQAAMRMTSHD